MDESKPDNGSTRTNEIRECLALLRDCLSMVAERQRRMEQEEMILREERSLREEQYPCDEYGMWFFNEDFKFDWM